jgi:hypothetical protein
MTPDAERWAIRDTLLGARLTVPPDLIQIPRSEVDDPVVVESWF